MQLKSILQSIKKLAEISFWFLTSPWYLTMSGEKYLAGKTGYGFIFLFCLPLLILKLSHQVYQSGLKIIFNQKQPVNLVWWFIFFFWLFWYLFAFHRGRHLMPVFSLLSVIISAFCLELFNKNSSTTAIYNRFEARLVTSIIAIGISFQIAISSYFNFKFFPVAAGLETRVEFLERLRPDWIVYQKINSVLDENSKVYTIWRPTVLSFC